MSEFKRCWQADSVTIGPSQASCFPLPPVIMVSHANWLLAVNHKNMKDEFKDTGGQTISLKCS